MKTKNENTIEATEAIAKVERIKTPIPFEAGVGCLFRDFDGMQRFAAAAVAAGYWKDCSNVAKATMKLQMGAEVGLKPIQSLNRIHVIEGKPALAAEAMVGLVKNSGKYRLIEETSDDEIAIVVVYENLGDKWQIVGRGSFSVDQASQAGLLSRHNWKSYTSDMLWARAVSRACRRHCADVVLGMYAVEDFDLREDDLGDHAPPVDQAASILDRVTPVPEAAPQIVVTDVALDDAKIAAQVVKQRTSAAKRDQATKKSKRTKPKKIVEAAVEPEAAPIFNEAADANNTVDGELPF